MHTLLGLASVALVVLGGFLALALFRWLGDWSGRRDVHLLVLAMPIVSLGLGVWGLHHFDERVCFLGAPTWDYTLGSILPLAMALVAFAGLGLALGRHLLLQSFIAGSGFSAGPAVQALADHLADRLGTARPRVRIRASDRPLALTIGLRRPTVVLSSWMPEQLDRMEFEAVLAHELAHVARRDYLVVWLATLLRDAFFYLPSSRAAYRRLQHEKELACDDPAVVATRRPLALASPLAKVWQRAAGGPTFVFAPSLLKGNDAIEGRIERLLDHAAPIRSTARSRSVALGVGSSALGGLLVLQAVNLVVMLAPMGCGPASQLRMLF